MVNDYAMTWKREVDEIFSVKATYNTLQGIVEIEGNKDFKLLWNTRVIPKAQMLGWMVFLDRLPTKVNL